VSVHGRARRRAGIGGAVEAQLRLEHTVVAVETEHRGHVLVELKAPPAPATADGSPSGESSC